MRMAANNYFGFTHGGTQYSAAPTPSYQPGQTGYTVGHTPQSYTATPRAGQAAGYEGYQTTHTSNTYGYTSRQQEAAPPPPPSTNATYETYGYARSANAGYDGTKTYYQQPSQSSYSTAADTHYQAASKPSYTANTSFTAASRQATNPKVAAATSAYGYSSGAGTGTSSYSSNYGSPATTTASYTGTTYSGYDAALYSAATIYVQQQQQATTPATNKNQVGGGWTPYNKKGNIKPNKPKQPPKPQQLHYCDVCKISCAGPQTYREHLEGQKHKKKEVAAKAGAAAQTARGGNSLRCELCDVTCTGADAYAAHIRGAKHQKVVKLHTKLGKPIPSTEPVVVTNSATNAASAVSSAGKSTSTSPPTLMTAAKTGFTADSAATKKVVATPKITFVGGTKLNTTSATTDHCNKEMKAVEKEDSKTDLSKLDDKPDIQPVGQDYIEEIKNDEGKVISFQCKLCECRFNDPNAKEMHMKGRRHRLQYKKKVNPDLVVDIKPSLRQRKLQEEKLRRQQMKEEFWRRREEERMMEEEERLYWEERRRYEEEMEYYEWYRRYGRDPRGMPPPPRPFPAQPPSGPPMPLRRPDSSDDRHVIAKHAQIYPKEEELQAVQRVITNTEKALKLVSDYLAETENALKIKQEPGVESKPESGDTGNKESDKKEESVAPRILKGVMRVGVLAKGLLLHGDLNVHLAVMCSEKPTRTLLGKVADNLPKQLGTVTEDKYEIKRVPEEAAIVVSASTEPKTSVTITLTSPVMRETNQPEGGESVNVSKDPPDVLDRQKCLDALAALRHAKWFQARANGLQSCVMAIRILRDLCQRVPTWAPLNSWAMELLVEKVISSAGQPLSPGDALRRVFEAIASGILLPGGPGLMDPCEKDPMDAASALSHQEREDITASAQHALRLLAFRQIHKVLGMDPLPPPKFTRARFNRKRRRDNSAGESTEGEDGKKDKKEDSDKADTMEMQDGVEPKV